MPITFVGSSIGTDTIVLPPVQAGDLLVVFAYSASAAVTPTQAAGSWQNIRIGSADNNGHRAAYRLATTNESGISSVWTNATHTLALAYRGVDTAQPIGTSVQLTGTADINYSAVNFQVTDGTSVAVLMHGRVNGSVDQPAPPNVTRRVASAVSPNGRVEAFDSGPITTSPARSTGGNNTYRYRSVAAEIRAAPTQGRSGTLAVTLDPLTAASSGKVSIRAALAQTLGVLTAASSGKVSIRAALAQTLGALSTVSAGKLNVRGSGSGNLAPMTATATGRVTLRGVVATTLGALSVVARSSSPGKAQVAVLLGALTSAARGVSPRRGAAQIQLGNLTGSSAGKGRIGGTLSGNLAPLTVSSTAKLKIKGAVNVGLAPLFIATTAALKVRGSFAGTLASVTVAAVGRFILTARVNIDLGLLSVVATGRNFVSRSTATPRVAKVTGQERVARAMHETRSVKVK